MYRSLLTAETVAHRLGAHADLRRVGVRFFGQLQYDQMFRLLQPAALQSLFLDVLTLLRQGPGDVQRLLSDLANERLTLHVRSERQPDEVRQENSRSQLVSAAIVFLGIAVLLDAGHQTVLVAPVTLTHLLWGALGLVGVAVLRFWRKLS